MTTLRELDVRLRLDTRQFDSALGGVQKKAGGLKESFGRMFEFAGGMAIAGALAGIGRSIAGVTGEALTAYATFERMGTALQTLSARELINTGVTNDRSEAMEMASARSKELVGWITKLAVNSPFNEEDVAISFRTAMTYGFASDEAQRLTESLVDYSAAGGLSSDANKRIMLGLGQIKTRGHLASQELNQISDAGVNAREILSKAFGVSAEKFQEMVEDGAIPAALAIELLTAEFEKDKGAAQAQAHTFTGLISSMQDLRSVTLRNLFGGVFKAAQPYLARFVDKFSDLKFQERITDFGNRAGAKLSNIFKTAESAASRFFNTFSESGGGIVGLLKGLGAAINLPKIIVGLGLDKVSFDSVRTGFETLVASLAGAVTTFDYAGTFATLQANAKSALATIDWTLVGTEFDTLKTNVWAQVSAIDWTSAEAKFDTLRDSVWGSIEAINWEAIGTELDNLSLTVWSEITAINWEAVGTEFDTLKTTVWGYIETIDWSAIGTEFDNLKTTIWDTISGLDWTTISTAFDTLNTTVSTISSDLSTKLAGVDAVAIGEKLSTVGAAVSDIGTKINSLATDTITTAAASLLTLGSAVLDFSTGVVSGLDAEVIANTLSAFASNITGKITAAFGDEALFATFGASAGAFVGTIISKIGEVLGTGGLGESIGESTGKGLSTLATAAMGLVTGLATELGKVDWIQFKGDIDTFTGGFVKGLAASLAEADFLPVADAMAQALGGTIVKALDAFLPFGFLGGEKQKSGDFGFIDFPMPSKDAILSAIVTGAGGGNALALGDDMAFPGWDKFITSVDLSALTPPLSWADYVEKVSLNFKVLQLSWSDFVKGIDLASWVPSFPGWGEILKSISFGGGAADNNATGTNSFRGGWTWVGEKGPELLNLPRGSQILSNQKSMGMIGQLAEGTGTAPPKPWAVKTTPISNAQAQARALGAAYVGSADKTTKAFDKAAKKTADAFKSALQKIPGLFGTSGVTQEQMDLAAMGVPQNFADDYVRHLSDEILNGVDWAEVDVADAAKRAGIDPNLPKEAILTIFKAMWADQSLFADAANTVLINRDAVQVGIDKANASEAGRANIFAMFGITPEDATGQAVVMGGQLRTGIGQGLVGTGAEGVTGIGQTLLDGIVSEVTPGAVAPIGTQIVDGVSTAISTNDTKVDIIGGLTKSMNSQLGTPGAIAQLMDVGAEFAKLVFQGFVKAAKEKDWASAVTGPATSAAPPAPGANAAGTSWWRGGLSWVGERGPELLNIPRGAQILPAHVSAALAGMGGMDMEPSVVNVYATVNNKMDMYEMARRVASEQRSHRRR